MEEPRDVGGPAFPTPSGYMGISVRDYFAAQAMQGMIASDPVVDRGQWMLNLSRCAKRAYEFADAMLAERLKP